MDKPQDSERQPLFGGPAEELNSLFGEILDWMLAPLLLVWPISIAATHHVANVIANQPYDQALADNLVVVVREAKKAAPLMPPVRLRSVHAPLADDEQDVLYFQLADAKGDVIAGDDEIPPPPVGEQQLAGEVKFRDDIVNGQPVRVAYQFLTTDADATPMLAQTAETRKQRKALASRIISGVLLPQFAVIPLAVILVYIGLSKGLSPLGRLRERIRGRRPSDLSPIPIRGVPDEVRPLVISFNEMMARLEENMKVQQRFIADAAHQMRTPVTGLKMQTELAMQTTDPVQMRADLERIAASTDRAAHLIQQLLALARAESSHEKARALEVLDLQQLVRDTTRDWVERALPKGIDLGLELGEEISAADPPLLIAGVPLLLREMLGNLIDNAIKYTAPGGHVTVRIRGGARAVIEVEDDGVGIPEADRLRVFERFYRVLGSDEDGSGLGLAIVREIAEMHGATVELVGLEAPGSLFRVIFPPRGAKAQSRHPDLV